jgi:type IX secretion system PorP/SprF family membrane protein
MKNILCPILLILFAYNESQAQQDPHYTQYMYNLSVINPAYAGSKENLSGGLLYRKQWVGIEDTPTTGTFFLHSPVGKNVGIGISAITDKIGPVEENNLYGDFSYTLKLGGEKRLALGIKTGLTFHKIDFNTIYPTLPDPEDDVFAGSNPSSASFNIGSGLLFYTNRFYLSVSIPNLLKTKYLDFNGISYGSEVPHYFVTSGYVIDLSENVKLKPFALVKTAFNTPVSLDVSTNFLFYNKFEIGATYRLEDSFGAMVNYAITPNLRIGYAYDKIVSDLKVTTPASHEVILLFNLNFSKKVSQSARYF